MIGKMASSFIIGVISDTHGLVRPEALDALAGSDAIVHAGDICGAHVIEALERIAPVHAIRGNNDTDAWGSRLPDELDVQLGGVVLHLIHDLNDLGPRNPAWSAVIAGHSHRPRISREGALLHFNPGSAGPRRFSLPISVGRLVVRGSRIEPELVTLAVQAPAARRKSSS